MTEIEEKRKRKFKLEENKTYSLRKLRNVDLIDFKKLIEDEYGKYLTVSEIKIVTTVNNLLVKKHCENYIYSKDDMIIITEASKIISRKLPIWIRKNIDIFERAHDIKSMWGEEIPANKRGQNFAFNSYE